MTDLRPIEDMLRLEMRYELAKRRTHAARGIMRRFRSYVEKIHALRFFRAHDRLNRARIDDARLARLCAIMDRAAGRKS